MQSLCFILLLPFTFRSPEYIPPYSFLLNIFLNHVRRRESYCLEHLLEEAFMS
jgi:hypothetical protein